jgi:hypothetical protein
MLFLTPWQATTGIWYDFYHAFDEFRDKHWKKFGSAPYVSPPVRKNWCVKPYSESH